MKESANGSGSLTSVQKAFSILEFLAGERDPVSLGQVAGRCRVSKPSAVRLLRTLQELGYVDRPENTRNYCLGPKLSLLAGTENHGDLKRHVRPALERLHEELNETVNLGLLVGRSVVYLDYIETTRPLRMIVLPGTSEPWERTALGRAIASALPEEERDRLIRSGGTPAPARRALAKKLENFAQRGYADESGESSEGAGCLAISLASIGLPRAALSVAAPLHRLTQKRRAEIARKLAAAIAALPNFLKTSKP